jgi:hypothetical protein
MKNLIGKYIVAMVIVALFFAGIASASEVLVQAKVDSVTVALDKNGKTYVRVIVNEERSLNGIKYQIGVPCMLFGEELVRDGKSIRKGDSFKAIAQPREYMGRVSYTVIALVK